MRSGYARVSTRDQNLDAEITALKEAGAARILAENVSGSKRARPELDRMLDQLREGEVVRVTNCDRLARSLTDQLGSTPIIFFLASTSWTASSQANKCSRSR